MSSIDKSYEEKRDFIRMKIDTAVLVEVGDGREPLHGVCKDLSGGGVLLELDDEVQPGSTVTVTLETNYGHNPMLKAKASVTRCSCNESGKYLTGLTMTEML